MLKCTLCQSEVNIDDRGSYPLCSECVRERLECKERKESGKVLDRDVGPLCMQCGLCCTVLSAEAKPSEVEHLANWSGKLPREIATVEKDVYSNEGRIVLHKPCVFLLGRATEYVRCRAYTTKRPAVCESYLCKLAVRYKAGLCSFHEAVFLLRASISRYGEISLFNWSRTRNDEEDNRTAVAIAAKKALLLLNSSQEPSLMVNFHLYGILRKNYKVANDNSMTMLSAMFDNFSNHAIELDQFFAPEDMKGWSTRDKVVAINTIYQVVSDFRVLFQPEKIE